MIIAARRAQYGSWGDDALDFAKEIGKDVVKSVAGKVLSSGKSPAPGGEKKEETNWPLIIGGGLAGVTVLYLLVRR
jgi:hypothetical protein